MMENSKKVFLDEFQEMLDLLAPINNKKHNNYILMFITKKYKYFILFILTYYFYKNYRKIKNYYYKLLHYTA